MVERNPEQRRASALIIPETPEETEWRRQTDRFIELGFWEELKFSETETYRLTIPKFFARPKTYDGRFDRPLAVETRIPLLSRLHQLLGFTEFIESKDITNQRRIPKKPYTVYIANSVKTVRGNF